MQERLLHFIWKHQYFDSFGLKTGKGEDLQIIHPGVLNAERGPDFLNAEILIDGIKWRGSVELHIQASSWKHHGHHEDPAYNNVVLHVLWDDGEDMFRIDGSAIPSVSLKSRTPTRILNRYQELVAGLPLIPCLNQLETASPKSVLHALDDELRSRIAGKAAEIYKNWEQNGKDWEQTAFEWISRHFGFGVNNEVFSVLASSIPYKILLRHRNNPMQVEAILFGMGGMLQGRPVDLYQSALADEFRFLRYKYGLKPKLKGFEWKFLRLRPSNFPTVRMAQLVSLLVNTDSITQLVFKSEERFDPSLFTPGDYWLKHYKFGKTRSTEGGRMGRNSRLQLYMNTVIPLRWAYGHTRGDVVPWSHVYSLLYKIPAEDNKITRLWNNAGVQMKTTLDSQAYMALFRNKCSQRRCLDCPVGINLLKSA